MSYHVTILRTSGGRRIPIGREEVTQAVASDRDLTILKSKERSLEITTANGKEDGPLLIWENGEIWTKNPDEKTLQLMIDLAAPLKARVRGDEFETYITPQKTEIHPDDKKAIEDAKRATVDIVRKTRRRQGAMYITIVGTFVLLGLLVAYFSRS